MVAILSLVIVLVVSLVIVRVATVALTLTGVSREMARFQARSAFTGAGFTTDESERMVGHPVRRRIILLLMLLGNAGIVTAVSSLILSFTGTGEAEGVIDSVWARVALLAVALVTLMAISHSGWVDRWMQRWIEWALQRWTRLDVRDYSSLLRLTGDYMVSELSVKEDDWLAGRTLRQLSLPNEGVLVLGIERGDGTRFVGAPRPDTELRPGDTLLLYGRSGSFEELDQRPAGAEGNRAHVQAVGRQRDIEREEAQREEAEEARERAAAEAAQRGSVDTRRETEAVRGGSAGPRRGSGHPRREAGGVRRGGAHPRRGAADTRRETKTETETRTGAEATGDGGLPDGRDAAPRDTGRLSDRR